MTALPKKLTAQEYLAIERKAAFKSEFHNGEMFAMAGASWFHTIICDNLVAELAARFKGGPCRPASRDLRVLVDHTGLYVYPDVVVVCGEPTFADSELDTLTNPRVILEVLSESTEGYDRGTKFRHYRQVESLQVYVLVAQGEPRIEQFVRQADGTWNLQIFADPAGSFTLATVGATVPLADVYRGVTFPPPEPLR